MRYFPILLIVIGAQTFFSCSRPQINNSFDEIILLRNSIKLSKYLDTISRTERIDFAIRHVEKIVDEVGNSQMILNKLSKDFNTEFFLPYANRLGGPINRKERVAMLLNDLNMLSNGQGK